MMVSNHLSNIPIQVVSEDVNLETSAIADFNGFSSTKQTVSIVELGRRLRKCARLGHTEQVHELMTRGAPFTTDWLGTSALHLAASNNHLETCEVLLRAGISRDARTKVDRTPLHLAAYEGHAKICELLLLNKAEVDPRDMLRMTPLHWAVEKQHDAVVELLLQYGADPTLISKFDKTPISIALEYNRLDLVNLLQLAAKLLTEQSELANAEESMESNAHATLVATQNINTEYQQQIDNDQMDGVQILSNQLNDDIIQDTTTNGNVDETNNDSNVDINEHIEEPTILKSATISSPSQLSTLQLLQEHGITMLPTDEGGLVNNVIQSGRTIVLSEGGKLVLAENRKLSNVKPIIKSDTIPIIKPVKKPIIIPASTLKNKKILTLTQEQFMAITKNQGNKPVLKKVSVEAFKKVAETAGLKYSMLPPLKTTPIISYNNSKFKKVAIVPPKDLNKTTTTVKMINPAALRNVIGASNPSVSNNNTISNNNVNLSEIETYKQKLKEAQAEIEVLKAALQEKELENINLKSQLQKIL